jgi:hypothetical protein
MLPDIGRLPARRRLAQAIAEFCTEERGKERCTAMQLLQLRALSANQYQTCEAGVRLLLGPEYECVFFVYGGVYAYGVVHTMVVQIADWHFSMDAVELATDVLHYGSVS